MITRAARITLDDWDRRYVELREGGLSESAYGGPLRRHVAAGDVRLCRLRLDNSAAALRLWNFLLTEEERLHDARTAGKKIVGTMKDLGTVPVMVYAFDEMVAFYPDGAWWIPCIMEGQAGLLKIADSLGVDDSFCPVRALLGAFVTKAHFPIPDLLTCSVGATCDDLSAIAQRLEAMGHPIVWWEIPHRRHPDDGERCVSLPGGAAASQAQLDFVAAELLRVRGALEACAGRPLMEAELQDGIRWANRLRRRLAELRELVFTAPVCPLPALEMLIAEMLAIHFCSDRRESVGVLEDLLAEAKSRVDAGIGVLDENAARVFWINPVADLRVMNLLEDVGGRVCGTEYLFTHALDLIPEDIPPMEALARSALADPMVGSPVDRADRICADIRRFDCEAVVFSRIPGASHCAMEGLVIDDQIRKRLGIPTVDLEVAPVTDAMEATVRTRLEALVETARERRKI